MSPRHPPGAACGAVAFGRRAAAFAAAALIALLAPFAAHAAAEPSAAKVEKADAAANNDKADKADKTEKAAKADKVAALPKTDLACLECHAKPSLDRALGDGKRLPLHVPPKAYAEGVHGETGCDGCHTDIDEKTHGKDSPKPLASRRALAKSMIEGCTDCHKKTVKLYHDSVHAAMVAQGSDKAPLCTDCHDVHSVRAAKVLAKEGAKPKVPCQTCHEGIVAAFNDSVHGAGGEDLACADCHRTHNVQAASLGDAMKSQCVSCHKEVVADHAKWLPNTGRHLEAVTCSACHSPGAARRVSLRLYDGAQQATEKVGVPQFVKLASAADAKQQGLDGRALWSLLQEFNRDGDATKMVLRGRLEVKSGAEAHRLGPKAKAVSDCNTCHRAGAEPFQTVSVTMAGPDGRPIRHEAQANALTSIESVGSVGGFYTLGATRIKLLDWLLLAALAGGIALPGLHLTAKLLTKRLREQRAALAASATAATETTKEPS